MTTIVVKAGGSTYPILVGCDLDKALLRQVKRVGAGRRVFVVFDAAVFALHGKAIMKVLPRGTSSFVLPQGERAKSQRYLAGLHDFLLGERISRSDLVVAVGGGVTTDLAGFAAASVLRGVRWLAVPTTLLAMVDAAIGGKTGINHGAGKNLIGAFWQPSAVIADVRFLETLAERELRAGLGEIVKYAGLVGGEIYKLLKQHLDDPTSVGAGFWEKTVALSAAYKGRVVSRDEREAGLRMVLNYGHTVGHGIEQSLRYKRLLHGEAVVLGIDAALRIGERMGYHTRGLEEYGRLVDNYLMSVRCPRLDRQIILQAMQVDKKRQGSRLRFVLLPQLGRPIIRDDVPLKAVGESVAETCNAYGR